MAQNFAVKGVVTDSQHSPLVSVNVSLQPGNKRTKTNANGEFILTAVAKDAYKISFSHIGYALHEQQITADKDIFLSVALAANQANIDEVYVTARESDALSTSSIIDRKAMELLQPSSFTDILELLPGGRSVDPNLTSNNRITLREATPLSGYNTNSLGTQFNMDGQILNSASSLASTSSLMAMGPNDSRDNTRTGIDMRGISTDNIERVEIIRGIASVEHGNLTSGVVLIDRVKGGRPWTARAKVDGFSKLFSIGKGFDFMEKGYKLNIDGGYLYANDSPIDIFTSYKRVNTSLRGEKIWSRQQTNYIWNHSIDFNTTIDGDRFDPDNDYAGTDRYEGKKQFYSLANTFTIVKTPSDKFFRSLVLTTNVNLSNNRIEMDKLIQASSATLLINSFEAGSYEAFYITPTYVTHVNITDQPLNIYAKAVSNWAYEGVLAHKIKVGLENSYSKNLGKGQQYDVNFPPSTKTTVRPRQFDVIPAYNNLSIFVEDQFSFEVGGVHVDNSLGVRSFTLTNLDQAYDLAGKINVEPRWNTKIRFPKIRIRDKEIHIALTGGYGQQVLAPTIAYLYPQMRYIDNAELNYYHNNPEFRVARAHTTIVDPTNYAIQNARAKKWEIGTDIIFEGNRLRLTYFKDILRTGFRGESRYVVTNYTFYDNTSVDPNSIHAKPDPSDFSSVPRAEYHPYNYQTNGSLSDKEGIEYQFTSGRIKGINTRFTVNGAWFRTIQRNDQLAHSIISTNVITDGKVRQYVALYEDVEGYLRERLNTNLIADSHLPRLGLNIAVSVQNLWWTTSQTLPQSDLPVGYYDIQGQYYAYTENDRNDPILRYFDRKNDPIIFRKQTVPIDLQVNVKATKSIRNKLRVAMFVNRLFTYTPTYQEYGYTYYRRRLDTPYFGMELNLTL